MALHIITFDVCAHNGHARYRETYQQRDTGYVYREGFQVRSPGGATLLWRTNMTRDEFTAAARRLARMLSDDPGAQVEAI